MASDLSPPEVELTHTVQWGGPARSSICACCSTALFYSFPIICQCISVLRPYYCRLRLNLSPPLSCLFLSERQFITFLFYKKPLTSIQIELSFFLGGFYSTTVFLLPTIAPPAPTIIVLSIDIFVPPPHPTMLAPHLPPSMALLLPPPPSADVKRAIVITNTRELIYEFPLLLDEYRSGDVDVDGGHR